MAARPYWKGQIRLALVSIPVEIYSATRSGATIAFNQIHEQSGRAAYFRLLDQGWTDALRAIHPGEVIYTFFDYFRNAYARNAGLRIDHLLLSPALADRLVDAQVDAHVRGWEKTSDHAPVWVELADKAKRRRKPAASSQAGAPL